MGSDHDKVLMSLFSELSEKTSALLHHLKSRDIERDLIAEMEDDLKKLQQQIKDRSEFLKTKGE